MTSESNKQEKSINYTPWNAYRIFFFKWRYFSSTVNASWRSTSTYSVILPTELFEFLGLKQNLYLQDFLKMPVIKRVISESPQKINGLLLFFFISPICQREHSWDTQQYWMLSRNGTGVQKALSSDSNLLLTGMRTALSCTWPGQEGDRDGWCDLLAQHSFHRHQVEHLCSVSICCSLCWYQCWGQSILQIRRAQWQKQIAHHLGMHSYIAQTVFLKYSVIAQYPPSKENKAWITANLSLPVNLEKLKIWIFIPHIENLKEGLLSPTYQPRRKSRLRLQLHHVLDHALGDMRIRRDVGTQLRLPESNHVNQRQMHPPPPKLHNRLVRRTLLHQGSCSLLYATYSSFALLWKKYPMILTR